MSVLMVVIERLYDIVRRDGGFGTVAYVFLLVVGRENCIE